MPHIPRRQVPRLATALERLESSTSGCHEALPLASTFRILVEQHLADHPAIRANPEWDALATTAVTALADLCHAIHKAHLEAQQLSQRSKG